MKITLLKLGGSLITEKSKAYTLRGKFIDRLSKEIFRAKKDNPEINLIIGTGAGSFAHQSATKYNTANGIFNKKDIYGASVVHFDAQRLNQIVVECLIKEGLPAYPLQPSALIVSSNKQIETFDSSIFENFLHRGFLPVTYGDVIFDHKIGTTILSTDTLFKHLAISLNKKGHQVFVIHAGDYDGVLDENENIIEEITTENFYDLKSLGKSESIDVTGGMRKKVEEMLELTKFDIKSLILNGTKDNVVYESIVGKLHGTLIR
jgi:isopentenyl phosphate kinase